MDNKLKKLFAFRFIHSRRPPFTLLYKKFQAILETSNQFQELMADMGEKLGGEYVFDGRYIEDIVQQLGELVSRLVSSLILLTNQKHTDLLRAYQRIKLTLDAELNGRYFSENDALIMAIKAIDSDAVDMAGEKMTGLAIIRNRLMLSTADGFVITTHAFDSLMLRNDLYKIADAGKKQWQEGNNAGLRDVARKMQEAILGCTLPHRLKSQIFKGFDDLARSSAQSDLRVVLRSSATGENGENSFAGQYATVLNVPRDQLLDGYRRVLASFYDFSAWKYRLQKGYRDNETHMAVGCQTMIPGMTSGVLHTFVPHIGAGSIVINSTWGLCAQEEQDKRASDTIVLDRTPPYSIISQEIAKKPRLLVVAETSGTMLMETQPEQVGVLSLSTSQIKALAKASMSIEGYYRRPQEIEWSYDAGGNLKILQTRPLFFHDNRFTPGRQLQEDIRLADIILSHRGYTVQCGVGVGRIFTVRSDEDLDKFPHGAILLSRHSSPRYATIMHKARGIITDIGSPTGHMATLAREYRVPTIVNTETATTLLHDGDEVTLDATQTVVYRGYLYALNSFELTEEEVFEDTYEFRLLRRMTRHISRLNLINTQSADFTPSGCRTYHDIVRYVHGKAIEKIILLSQKAGTKDVLPAKRLDMDIPLGLLVIDGGGGTDGPEGVTTLAPNHIVSTPLRELLNGIIRLGMWCNDPVSVNLGSFMSSVTRTFCTTLASPQEIGQNLAVVLKNYANVNLRLGYHFTFIDAYISEVTKDNYINFRFWGGVTQDVRRHRRASFIATVLKYYDFLVEIYGDLIVARLKMEPHARISGRMRMLGGLVSYTRQLDACMNSEHDITEHAEIFINAINRTFSGDPDGKR
jgi:pyruvate,water dikinase